MFVLSLSECFVGGLVDLGYTHCSEVICRHYTLTFNNWKAIETLVHLNSLHPDKN